jgi:hypothetical protein
MSDCLFLTLDSLALVSYLPSGALLAVPLEACVVGSAERAYYVESSGLIGLPHYIWQGAIWELRRNGSLVLIEAQRKAA